MTDNMRKFLFILTLLLPTLLNAQIITGKLVDQEGQPLPYANIMLQTEDSTFVDGTISNETGIFKLTNNGRGKFARISSIGYSTIYREIISTDMGTIVLGIDPQLLAEVIVKGNLPKVQLKGDAMVTRVEGTILEKAGTLAELLDKVPNVTVKDEKEVTVFSRGTPEIYINGRLVRDNMELSQVMADNIMSVEVVNNPGARYDAEVRAVIRITTKKIEGDGFGFDNTFRTSKEHLYGWQFRETFKFNYRKNGFDLSGTLYGFSNHSGGVTEIITDTYLDKHWHQELAMNTIYKSKNLEATLSANYQINENHVMGIRYNYDYYPEFAFYDNSSTNIYCDNTLIETSNSTTISTNPETRHQVNYYYIGKFGDWSIDFNADGYWGAEYNDLHSENDTDSDINTFYKNTNDLYAAKLVATYPLWKGNLTMGSEYNAVVRTNRYYNPEGVFAEDNSKFYEQDASAFVEYGQSFGNIDATVGLRYEYIDFDYYEYQVRIDEQSRVSHNLFPSFSVSAPIKKAQTQLSYSMDIRRPWYGAYSNNMMYINKYTYTIGNPHLLPTIYQSLSASLSYEWFNFTLGYNHIKDDFNQCAMTYDINEPTITLVKYINIPKYDQVSASLVLSPTIGFWSPTLNLMVEKQWYMGETKDGPTAMNTPFAMISWNNDFELPYDITFNIDAYYTSRGYATFSYFNEPYFTLDLKLQRSFLKESLNIQLYANDILESGKNNITQYCGNRYLTTRGPNYRTIGLQLRYKFNATQSKYRGTGAGQSAKNRIN